MKFNRRINNIEVRSCSAQLLVTGVRHTTAEIIEWYDNSKLCYAVAYWVKDKEGYNLTFVKSRPLSVNKDDFWEAVIYGERKLNKYV
jgi:hypothetical protein